MGTVLPSYVISPSHLPNCAKRVTSMMGRRPWFRIWRPSSTHAVRAVKVRSALMPVSLSSMRDADPAHRFEHLDLERPDAQVGRLQRRASRRVEGVLLAVAHDAEAAVEDAEVRVQRGADAEVELAVVLVAVEPVAVVGVAVAAHGRRDRLRRLVDRVVVELAQHCGLPGWPWTLGVAATRGQRNPRRSRGHSRRTPRNTAGRRNLAHGRCPRDRDSTVAATAPTCTARRPTTAVEIVVPVHDEERGSRPRSRPLHGYLTDQLHGAVGDHDRRQRQHRRARGRSRSASRPRSTACAACTSTRRAGAARCARRGARAQRTRRRVHGRRPVDRSRRAAPARRAAAERPQRRRHRHAPGIERTRRARPKRELISRGYNLILRTTLRAGFSDAQCGFKAVRADVARELPPLVEDQGWFFDTELLVLAEHNGLRIHEVPVDWVDDPVSRVDIVRTAADDLRGVWRMIRRFAA